MKYRKEIGPLAAEASWHMGHWNEMSEYLTKPNSSKDTPDATRTAFLNAVLAIHDKNYPYALSMVDEARGHLSGDLAVLAGESYDRAYENMVMAQQLTEVEEAIQYVIAREHGQQGKHTISLLDSFILILDPNNYLYTLNRTTRSYPVYMEDPTPRSSTAS